MTRRLGISLLCLSMAAFGCADDDPPPPRDGGGDAATDGGGMDGGGDGGEDGSMPQACTGGTTEFYYANTVAIGTAMPEGSNNVPGLNLDGVDDDSLCENDRPSAPVVDYEWDGMTGVDNQLYILVTQVLASFLDEPLNDTLAASLAAGEVVILAEVSGVDDFTNDDCVNLSLLLGVLPSGADVCDDDMDGVVNYLDSAPDDGTVTTVEPGLTFNVDEGSFEPGTMTPLIGVNGATIENGEVVAGPQDITLDLPLGDQTLSLTVRDASVVFDITTDTLDNGLIAGSILVDDLLAAAGPLLGDGIDPATLRPLLLQGADVLPNADSICEGFSAGITFGAIDAMEGDVVSPDTAPMCVMPDGGMTDGGMTDSGMTDGGT